jgi:TolB-like protein
METGTPASVEVLAALQRVIAGPTFAHAKMSANLLRYVVEKASAGQTDDIKEYTLAVEVFGRASYDPQVDSLVRVQAGKLRKRLAKYYESEGRSESVRIEIPKGSYVPTFRPVVPDPQPSRADRKRILAGLGLVIVASMAIGAYRIGVTSQPPLGSLSAPALAVIPFVDLTPSQDNAQLCRGLTEELISMLARVDGLRVASRTSVSQYQGRPIDFQRIAGELKVQAFLEGSLRVERGRIRVIAQLVNTRDGFHLWTGTYDREIAAMSDIQREIAGSIFQDFVKDLHDTRRALAQRHSRNVEARHYYMRAARFHLVEPGKAIELYQAAVAADPEYALAWAALSQAWVTVADWGERSSVDTLPRAAEAARRALAIDETVPEAHHASGTVRALYEQDWAGAEGAFRRALELDPTYVDARHDYAVFVLNPTARFGAALEQLQQALALSAKKNFLYNQLANTYIKARQFDKAIKPLEASQKLEPTAPAVWTLQGMLAIGLGRYEEALQRFEKAASIRRTPWMLSHLGYANAKLDRPGEARKIISELERVPNDKLAFDYELATIHAALGEKEAAFAALDRSVASLSPEMIWIKVDYRLDDLRSDPRFGRLLKKMRLE